jgi:hypothetical protein
LKRGDGVWTYDRDADVQDDDRCWSTSLRDAALAARIKRCGSATWPPRRPRSSISSNENTFRHATNIILGVNLIAEKLSDMIPAPCR